MTMRISSLAGFNFSVIKLGNPNILKKIWPKSTFSKRHFPTKRGREIKFRVCPQKTSFHIEEGEKSNYQFYQPFLSALIATYRCWESSFKQLDVGSRFFFRGGREEKFCTATNFLLTLFAGQNIRCYSVDIGEARLNWRSRLLVLSAI